MPPVERRTIAGPELRTTAFYFAQFMTAGASAVYAGIWFTEKGLSSSEIGIINAVPVLVMLVLNLVVGRIADRADDWRQVIVIGALISGVASLGLFFATGFWGILLVWAAMLIPVQAIGPVADAATLRMTRRNGTDYGFIRAWGTVGYMAVIFVTGYLVATFGGGAFVPWLAAVALLRAALSLPLPRFRAPREERALAPVAAGAAHLLEVMKPWFLLPLVGWAMVFGTHLILNAFQGLLWKQQGIPESVIGPLIALGAFSEAAMMFAFRRLSGRFKARHLILLSAGVSVLRWLVMGFSPPVPVLVGLQLLHSITFALGFMGCVNFIANWTSEDIAAEAQSFFTVLQQAMSVIALVGFGWLVSVIGAHAYFVAAVFALIGAVLIWSSLRMMAGGKAEQG
jgi:PPP family 3-phenylpropionic acid transporter